MLFGGRCWGSQLGRGTPLRLGGLGGLDWVECEAFKEDGFALIRTT